LCGPLMANSVGSYSDIQFAPSWVLRTTPRPWAARRSRISTGLPSWRNCQTQTRWRGAEPTRGWGRPLVHAGMVLAALAPGVELRARGATRAAPASAPMPARSLRREMDEERISEARACEDARGCGTTTTVQGGPWAASIPAA